MMVNVFIVIVTVHKYEEGDLQFIESDNPENTFKIGWTWTEVSLWITYFTKKDILNTTETRYF